MPLRTLVVEDEPHSLSRLKRLLMDIREVEVVGAAENGEDAICLLDDLKPDLVFLDVQLPGMTGFEVLARVRHRPAVVFVTAFDRFAVKAFEENAVDYLLKPTAPDRLRKAVEKVVQVRRPADLAMIADLTRALAQRLSGRIFSVKHRDEILLIPEREVYFFKAEDRYVFLATAEQSFFYDATLKDLEASLDADAFLRVHKGAIVAIDKIRKLCKGFLNDYVLEMRDAAKTRFRVGRSYLPALKQKLKL